MKTFRENSNEAVIENRKCEINLESLTRSQEIIKYPTSMILIYVLSGCHGFWLPKWVIDQYKLHFLIMEPMDKWITVISHLIPWSRNPICSERILNSDVKSCVEFIYSIEYLRVYSHRESAMALSLTLALTLVLTLGRNTLVSIAPFTPDISIRINISIKNQMGSGLIQKQQRVSSV